jgi:hypothetical protein
MRYFIISDAIKLPGLFQLKNRSELSAFEMNIANQYNYDHIEDVLGASIFKLDVFAESLEEHTPFNNEDDEEYGVNDPDIPFINIPIVGRGRFDGTRISIPQPGGLNIIEPPVPDNFIREERLGIYKFNSMIVPLCIVRQLTELPSLSEWEEYI